MTALSGDDSPLAQLSVLQCRIVDAFPEPKSNVPLTLKVEMRNTSTSDVWVAPAHHITDLYYEEGESHMLRLGLRCRLSKESTPGSFFLGSNGTADFTVEATPFGDMPEGEYVITLVLSPVSAAYQPRYSAPAERLGASASGQQHAPAVLASAPFTLHWKEAEAEAGQHAPPPAVARCVAEEQMAAYFSPRTSRPRARAKSRPSLSHIGAVASLLPASRAAGSREDGAEAAASEEALPLDDPAYLPPADISPLARFATGRRYSLA